MVTREELIALIKQLLMELRDFGCNNKELLHKAQEVVEYEELKKND